MIWFSERKQLPGNQLQLEFHMTFKETQEMELLKNEDQPKKTFIQISSLHDYCPMCAQQSIVYKLMPGFIVSENKREKKKGKEYI